MATNWKIVTIVVVLFSVISSVKGDNIWCQACNCLGRLVQCRQVDISVLIRHAQTNEVEMKGVWSLDFKNTFIPNMKFAMKKVPKIFPAVKNLDIRGMGICLDEMERFFTVQDDCKSKLDNPDMESKKISSDSEPSDRDIPDLGSKKTSSDSETSDRDIPDLGSKKTSSDSETSDQDPITSVSEISDPITSDTGISQTTTQSTPNSTSTITTTITTTTITTTITPSSTFTSTSKPLTELIRKVLPKFGTVRNREDRITTTSTTTTTTVPAPTPPPRPTPEFALVVSSQTLTLWQILIITAGLILVMILLLSLILWCCGCCSSCCCCRGGRTCTYYHRRRETTPPPDDNFRMDGLPPIVNSESVESIGSEASNELFDQRAFLLRSRRGGKTD